jgi:predicted DNA-binding protein with PD1-like motif
MTPRPLRLPPGVDLRRELERMVGEGQVRPGFVIAGIGSIVDAVLRFADRQEESVIAGPHEVLSLAGSLTPAGAHLHASVADNAGQVLGGHLSYGNIVRTTAELLLVETPAWALTRAPDAVMGFNELVVEDRPAT